MKTQVTAANTVEYDFEIEATDADLAERINDGLKKIRPKVQMKGFRPGHVPLSLVKKLHGRAVAYEAAEEFIQELFTKEVLESDTYEVLGSPVMTDLDYDMGQDLKAVIRFGIRPTIELASVEGETITKLVLPVDDEDIDGQIEYARHQQSVLRDSEDGIVGDDSTVTIEMQLLADEEGEAMGDASTETIVMKDTRIRAELLDAIRGSKVGDVVSVSWENNPPAPVADETDSDETEGDEAAEKEEAPTPVKAFFKVSVVNVQERDLPELTPEFIAAASNGEAEDEATFREKIREGLERSRDKQSAESFEQKIIDKVLEKHEFEVPESVVETYLDAMVKEFKDRYKDSALPGWFEEGEFRKSRRTQAEQSARWMLIRDKVVEEHGLTIEEEEMDAKFDEMAQMFGDTFDGIKLRQMYDRLEMTENVRNQALTAKVLDFWTNQVTVVEKSRSDFETPEPEVETVDEETTDEG